MGRMRTVTVSVRRLPFAFRRDGVGRCFGSVVWIGVLDRRFWGELERC